ncbi:MAG TPA: uracil-DNA glycosylase family protein, partial [Ignavibacteriaceae bacterium]
MNPFRENPSIIPITELFYNKFYNDKNERYLLLGINPGRHGAGVTGIPFTDTMRLEKYCGIKINGFNSYETSSEFIYRMIDAYGGVKKFYSRYYINAICPLGFTKTNTNGKNVNYNYYDDKQLTDIVSGFMLKSL